MNLLELEQACLLQYFNNLMCPYVPHVSVICTSVHVICAAMHAIHTPVCATACHMHVHASISSEVYDKPYGYYSDFVFAGKDHQRN